jgi:small-conductance mechanosensitive channel
MNKLMINLSALIMPWLTPGTLIGTVLLGMSLLVGFLISRLVARWQPLAANHLAREVALIAAPYGAMLLLLLLSQSIESLDALDPRFITLSIELLALLAAIHGLAFLVRVSLSRNHQLRAWEFRGAILVWLFAATHVLGWLQAFIGMLDSILVMPTKPGDASLTVWTIIRSLFTVVAFLLVSAWVGRALERRIQNIQGLASGTRIAVSKFVYAFLIGLGALMGLSASGLNLAAFSIFGGALGLGLGFGLQAIAANFVSGFVLLMDKSIKPGDVISFTGLIGTHTEGFGWVQELRGRYVVIRDRDGVETLVPNQNLITNQVINWSYSDKRVRLKLPVRVSYDSDPEEAMRVLLQAATCSPRILKDPTPVARLMGFHEYGLDMELRFWIADPEAGVNNVRSDVNRAIWRIFKENNIRIPRAQLDVRMFDADGHIVGQGLLPALHARKTDPSQTPAANPSADLSTPSTRHFD